MTYQAFSRIEYLMSSRKFFTLRCNLCPVAVGLLIAGHGSPAPAATVFSDAFATSTGAAYSTSGPI